MFNKINMLDITKDKHLLSVLAADLKMMSLKIKKAEAAKLEKEILNMYSAKEVLSRHSMKEVMRQVIIDRYEYETSVSEFFLFEFMEKTPEEKYGYLSSRRSIRMLADVVSKEQRQLFRDKYKCYQTYKKFYHRDVIKFESEADLESYQQFIAKHKVFMVKPIAWSYGMGIYVADIDKDGEKAVYEGILAKKPVVIEEKLNQAEEMARFHRGSVNTIRFSTYINNGKVKDVYASLRMGVGNSVVDNAAAGGIIADVDLKNGVVCSDGYRENGESFCEHPDSKIVLKGAQIPEWDELVKTVHEMASTLEGRKFIGWDMAYSDKGWAMIEGNSQPVMVGVQMSKRRGIRGDVEAVLNEM